MRELFHPIKEQISMTNILNALGDPVRLEIVKNLAKCEETTCGSCQIDLPKSALSHHFRVLRESGLIRVRIDGKQRFLSLRLSELEEQFPGLLKAVILNVK